MRVKVEVEKCDAFVQIVVLEAAITKTVHAVLQCQGVAADVEKGLGRINVTATVMADVFIDGKKLGRTPMLGQPLAAGKHQMKLVPLAGDKPPMTQGFELKVGKSVSISHRF
ncbi:MAG TPA: PEGA domain-containing protein [Myxococcales bacterium]|nr:PEGA domain-containing protein [Myxococcales bacterium]